MKCVVTSKCPRQPGWSAWGEWSSCIPNESDKPPTPDSKGCSPGTRFRVRKCNNPPPDPGPSAIQCPGQSQEVKPCKYGCDETPKIDEYFLRTQVSREIEKDHLNTRVRRKSPKDHADVVIIRTPRDSAILDCETEAYKFAKESLEQKTKNLDNLKLPTQSVAIFWQLGGRTIAAGSNYVAQKERRIIPPIEELVEEENAWLKQLKRTAPIVQGTKLILNNLKPHDTGFYTCHLKISKDEWFATFFSLIVLGQQFSAPAQMPFYLHSNLGEWSAFAKSPIRWYDASRIQWRLNGEVQFTDLAVRSRARIRLIPHMRIGLQGQWECFLIVPLPNAPTVQASRNITFSASFLINSFFLRVTPRPQSLWELGDRPPRISMLRLVAVFLTIASLGLLIALILTIWAVRRWVQRTPRLDQLESAVEEVIDDRTRLFINAQQQARKRRDLLLPFVRQKIQIIEDIRRNPPPEDVALALAESTLSSGDKLSAPTEKKETKKGMKGLFEKLKSMKKKKDFIGDKEDNKNLDDGLAEQKMDNLSPTDENKK